jgi:hypothetical protein
MPSFIRYESPELPAHYIALSNLEKRFTTIDGGLVDRIAFDDTRSRAFQNAAQFVYYAPSLPRSASRP